MALQSVVEQCVTDLGYELVDIEHGPGGLLRVFIDVLPGSESEYVRIEDCERVSHQLSHLFTVENIDYARLEISSPGLDRPLRKAADFERFEGMDATVRLRRPLEGRKNFEGVITVEGDGRFGLVLSDEHAQAGKGAKAGKGARGAKAGKGGKGKSNAKPVADRPAADEAADNAADKAAAAAGREGSEADMKGGALPAAGATAGMPAGSPEGGADGAAETLRKLVFALDEIDRARLVPKVKF